MRHDVKDLTLTLGPLLAFDACHQQRLAAHVYDDGFDDSCAKEGWCTWLSCDGMAQFSGDVELLVEEPAPHHTQYAEHRAENLWLRLPSGTLVLTGPRGVRASRQPGGDVPRRTFAVAPGDYAVDAWGYLGHETRLENGPPLDGQPPLSRWRWLVLAMQLASALVTVLGFVVLIPIVRDHDWSTLGRVGGGVVGAWLATNLVSFATGESRRAAARRERFARAVAALPPVPRLTLVLRRVATPPAEGGGLSS